MRYRSHEGKNGLGTMEELESGADESVQFEVSSGNVFEDLGLPNATELLQRAQLAHEKTKKIIQEIGPIKPWWDQEVDAWIYSHPDYPVEYGGESCQEVIDNYPAYLEDFVWEYLNNNISPQMLKKLKKPI